jgi:hypothetical protein
MLSQMADHFESRLAEILGAGKPRYRSRFVHGARTKHPDYNCWRKMRSRCNDTNNAEYRYYGGRGIRVCERWADFAVFMMDMGARPTPAHTIDRINNDGNYEPDNCRWATMAEQNRNKRKAYSVTPRP